MANIQVSLNGNSGSASIAATDLTTSQQILSRILSALTLGAVALTELSNLQTSNGTVTITLPAATVFFVYIRNLDTTGDFTVNYTPTVGTPGTMVLQRGATAGQGGILLYFQPSGSGAGGITALSITATAILKAEVIVAG